MSKTIYVQFLSEQPNSNLYYLNRLIKLLNHFISIEPEDKMKLVKKMSEARKRETQAPSIRKNKSKKK